MCQLINAHASPPLKIAHLLNTCASAKDIPQMSQYVNLLIIFVSAVVMKKNHADNTEIAFVNTKNIVMYTPHVYVTKKEVLTVKVQFTNAPVKSFSREKMTKDSTTSALHKKETISTFALALK